ncbi:MAG: OmpA family protein [Magnetococcales bacterium]|nr:OmpA family protein [Magnetococcales bacterium]
MSLKRIGMGSPLVVWMSVVALSGGVAGCAPQIHQEELKVEGSSTVLESMVRGAPCYHRGAVDFCADLNDADSDGVKDTLDQCPATPKGIPVDPKGCPLDSDGDGVTDDLDRCPKTPHGVQVDEKGCPLDADGDGVSDELDQCPDTPKGAKVNDVGCWVLENLLFQSSRHELDPASHPELDAVARVLVDNPAVRIEIQGHTDHVGSPGYNEALSKKRARSVLEYLVEHGIPADRMTAIGLGMSKPVASNDSEAGRAKNRRVVLQPVP